MGWTQPEQLHELNAAGSERAALQRRVLAAAEDTTKLATSLRAAGGSSGAPESPGESGGRGEPEWERGTAFLGWLSPQPPPQDEGRGRDPPELPRRQKAGARSHPAPRSRA